MLWKKLSDTLVLRVWFVVILIKLLLFLSYANSVRPSSFSGAMKCARVAIFSAAPSSSTAMTGSRRYQPSP